MQVGRAPGRSARAQRRGLGPGARLLVGSPRSPLPATAPRPPQILPASGGRKWWRLRREVEAPVGAGAARRSLPDRKPVPRSFPFSKHLGPLLPRAGRVRTLVRAVTAGVPAAAAHSFAGRGRGRRARAPREGERLGQGQAPCGPRCRAKAAAAGPAGFPAPGRQGGHTPGHGVEGPSDPRGPARSDGKVTHKLRGRSGSGRRSRGAGTKDRARGRDAELDTAPPAPQDPVERSRGRGSLGGAISPAQRRDLAGLPCVGWCQAPGWAMPRAPGAAERAWPGAQVPLTQA